MTEPAARPRRWWKYILLVISSGIVLMLAGLWYTTTASFQAYVRGRMVEEVERITGGKAEIGSFHVVPFHMQIEVRDITVRGTEPRTDIPLAHADHLVAQMKVISFLRTEFGFHSLTLDHPVVHIEVAADGSTNIPAPKVPRRASETAPVEQLFALSIDHLSMTNGELIWAGRNIPLDLAVRDASLKMDYSFLRGRYESRVALGKVDTTIADLRPFSSMTAVEFSLGTTFADIRSLKWSSGRSSLEASGRVSDFRNPRIDGSYAARVDLAEAAAIVRRHDLREGLAEFKGSGHWTFDDFATSGALALHDLGWQDGIAVRKSTMTADYSVTDQQIKVSRFQGRVFGGSVAGDAQVDNWLRNIPPLPPAKVKKGQENLPVVTAARPPVHKGDKVKIPGVQVGVVHFRVRDISAGEVAAAIPETAKSKFRPAGQATGSVDVAWRGLPKNADVTFALDVNPTKPSAGEVPVTAHLQGVYRGERNTLELSQLNLSTPASRLQASGTFSDSSTVRFSLATANLDEWRPVVAAAGGPAKLPFHVNGSVTFNGVASGGFTAPTVAGTLSMQDFDFTLPPSSRTPEQQVQWDSLASSIQLSAHELSLHGGSLRRGDTSADFDLSAVLQDWQFTETTPYTARVNLHSVDVASTAALAGFDYPVSGTADVSLQISGTRQHPQVQGHIHAGNASAYGESIEQFDADLHIAGAETGLDNIHLTHQDAAIDGTAAYTPATRAFRLDLTGTNFDVSRIRQMHLDELPIEGRADFTLKGSGTLDSPEIDAQVHVRDLTLDHELAGGVFFEAQTRNGEMRIKGHSDLPHGSLSVEGNVAMSGDYPANITASVEHVDLDSLWRAWLGTQLTGHSSVVGSVNMQGPLRYPKKWTLRGDASDIAIELETARLHSVGPVHFIYSDQTAHIDPVHMVGEGTDLTGHGSIGFGGTRDLDLAADGQVDLKLFAGFDPDLTASGMAMVHMTVGGTLSEPMPQGTIQIKNGGANYAGLPSGLSEMNGSLSFARDRIHVDSLTARTGGGTIDLKGEATHYNHDFNFNFTAIGKDVRLRYPPGVSSTATAELHWAGTKSASTVSGDVLVTKLAVTPGFDFGSYLEHSRQAAATTPANSPLYNVKLDVSVRTAPELQMKTAVARLSGDADLHVRGSVARPSVLGRADILEGDATFNGIKFRLERGDITFANPVAIAPQINLQATTHVRNYDLDVTVTGTPDHPLVNYRSEPPLPKSDIIALLALGRTSEESEQLQQQSGQGVFTDEATALIINQAINQTVSNRLQKLFGVSRIKIDPQGLTTETNPTARGPQVTIEQQFANNVSLTYSTNVSQSSQQIIQGEYYFNRNISLVGTRDQNGVVSFDVRIRRRKK